MLNTEIRVFGILDSAWFVSFVIKIQFALIREIRVKTAGYGRGRDCCCLGETGQNPQAGHEADSPHPDPLPIARRLAERE